MKHCDFCGVEIEDSKMNCALCGKCINSDAENKNSIFPNYPILTDKREPVIKILEKLSLLALLLSFAVDLFCTRSITWSLYVFVGLFLDWVLVLRPIKKQFSFAQILTLLSFYLTAFLIFLELYTHTWGWGVMYAIPFMLLGFSVLAGIMTLARGYVDFDMFKPMIMIAFLSCIALILLLCFDCPTVWPTLVTFLFSVSEIILMFMFRFKRSVRSLKKNFGI